MPYLSEICLFAAAFLTAFFYGEDIIKLGLKRLVEGWRRGRRR